MRYSTFDRELLAVFLAVRHFRFLLDGRPFSVHTDHKPLVAAISKQRTPFSARQQRQLSFLSEFSTTFVHVPGKENVVADALSRPAPICTLSPATSSLPSAPFSYEALARDQATCPDIASLQNSSSLTFSSLPISPSLSLLGDISTSIFRPVLPLAYRRPIFDHIHSMGHPGVRATRRLVSSRFVWPGMASDLANWARLCVICQQSKIHKHVHPSVTPIPIPTRRFSHLHIDLVGPLPISQGCTFLFTLVDRTTRWLEAVPLASTTAKDCAEALCAHWVTRFGVPHTLTSDRGPQSCALSGLNCPTSCPLCTYPPQPSTRSPTAWWSAFTGE